MNRAVLAAHANTLGDLFAYLWDVVAPHIGDLSSRPWHGDQAREKKDLSDALSNATSAEVPEVIIAYMVGENVGFACEVAHDRFAERAFVVMVVIDIAARAIHPRAGSLTTSAKAAAVPAAIAALREDRWVFGHYGGGIDGSCLCVPKGPLRASGDDIGASGDRLDIHFENLAALKVSVGQHRVAIKAVTPAEFGLPAGGAAPKIGTAAIAQDPDDLTFLMSERLNRCFLDVRPTDASQLARVTVDAIGALLDNAADIVLLPELCVSAEAVEATMSAIKARGPGSPSLVVMGSGLSEDAGGSGKHFNECSVLDRTGRVLWHQRKLNHFNMAATRMNQCEIGSGSLVSEAHLEDVATGHTLEIRDVPGFGRTMVLICEDLEQDEPGGVAASMLRPDWILAPVLDTSLRLGRWSQTRAHELGRRSQTKLVVACSGSLEARSRRKAGQTPFKNGATGYALCIDPADRRYKLVTAADASLPGGAAVTGWEPASWEQYQVSKV